MNEYQQQRRERTRFSGAAAVGQGTALLPPHSEEAERGVLGCLLLDPQAGLQACLRRMKSGSEVFYDVRHQEIFKVLIRMFDREVPIDIISTQEELKLAGQLENVGGLAYLSALPDAVPSAANLDYYVGMLLEKYFLRRTMQICTEAVGRIGEYEGEVDVLLDQIDQEFEALSGMRRNSLGEEVAPKFLKRPDDFGDEVFRRFFRDPMEGEPGLELPIHFPFKIRRKECTLVYADDGAGKSTLLSWFAVHLAAQEGRACIASFEEPGYDSVWRMASQLIGSKYLPDSDPGRRAAREALDWLSHRFYVYDFLGISDWRDVLETFRYAAKKHGVWLFVLDSVMRIGIPDDDWAQQGLAATQFAHFAQEHNAHLMFVMHTNAGNKEGKDQVRGSKLWRANANNICGVKRNMKKGEATGKLEMDLANEKRLPDPDRAQVQKLEKELFELKREWDTHFRLDKQRFAGSQQNGSKFFWFSPENFQFREHWEDQPVNWLKRYKNQRGSD